MKGSREESITKDDERGGYERFRSFFMPRQVWRGRSFDFAQDRLSPAKTALRLEIPFWKQICRPCSFVTDTKLGTNSLWNRRWRAGPHAFHVHQSSAADQIPLS